VRYLILSDVHANWIALEAVLDFLKRNSIEYDRVISLGDYVDYGPHPNEVIEWFKENCGICLLGNHDEALLNPSSRRHFSDLAYRCSAWTERHIHPNSLNFLKGLKPVLRRDGVTYVHAAPSDPLWMYIFTLEDAALAFRDDSARIIFVGHTHVPSYFARSKNGVVGGQVVGRSMRMEFMPGVRYIINPGSVGQPRDRLPGASFGIYDEDDNSFTWYRVDYDIDKLKREIKEVGLPMALMGYFL